MIDDGKAHKVRPPIAFADADGLLQAAEVLRAGGIVAMPTETVYGLCARADDPAAVARIFAAKGRPSTNPLIVHVANRTAAAALAHFDMRADALAERFWPGPLTLVLSRKADSHLAEAVSAGLATVALRCPSHPVMQALLDSVDFPLAAPSANRSGAVSPTAAQHVLASLGSTVDMIVDGGHTADGLESTIVILRDTGWQLLRPGPVLAEDITALAGPQIEAPFHMVEAPGQHASHYAPGKPVRLNARKPASHEFFIGFGSTDGDVNLSAAADLREAAANLYACLHLAAASPCPAVAVAMVPSHGFGIAINDRLSRAAMPPESQCPDHAESMENHYKP
ncbi:L-threonylcarbamoyladenylate synthase [Croceicoccus sp. F390]|uniref:Threonylcarbamoyl-AMP synthase n=1 Tax=Croceicoccus esteveae TaxID=3075597 RepID=A0ABU2ZIU9_9SPHN|nr:L-threonylcarbamoyladenylate synthase [Croceicoccus sp. F390]MDT0576229.1 L-threonylcarbamoyladenylate synthase [Croceicoccus sp. F390]